MHNEQFDNLNIFLITNWLWCQRSRRVWKNVNSCESLRKKSEILWKKKQFCDFIEQFQFDSCWSFVDLKGMRADYVGAFMCRFPSIYDVGIDFHPLNNQFGHKLDLEFPQRRRLRRSLAILLCKMIYLFNFLCDLNP